MATHPSIFNSESIADGRQSVTTVSEPKAKGLLQRIEVLLRKVFEGHEEFLGWTPD